MLFAVKQKPVSRIPAWQAYGDLFTEIRERQSPKWSLDQLVAALNEDAAANNLAKCKYSARSLEGYQTNPTKKKSARTPRPHRQRHLHAFLAKRLENIGKAEQFASHLAAIAPLESDVRIEENASWDKKCLTNSSTEMDALRNFNSSPKIAPPQISLLGRKAGCEHLIGRDNEHKALDFAWNGDDVAWQNSFNQNAKKGLKLTGHPIRPRIIVFNAWAGIGKTSLVVRWAAEKLANDNHSGIDRYFDWSFYRQGSRVEGVAPTSGEADLFLKEALEFFGDPGFATSNATAWKKGEHLAKLVGQYRTLLVLDGVEPLQNAKTGELGDNGLRALLRGLVVHNPGLCVITTRQHLPELDAWHHTTAPEWKLAHLSDGAGADLLTALGVNGNNPEKCKLSARVKGHALTLSLLGRYLKRFHHGDIRRVDCVDFRKVNEKELDGHAFRVIAAYERRFKKSKCLAELCILRMLGLFDRPATPDSLSALSNPPIAKLTDSHPSPGDEDWNAAVTDLVELGLVEEQPWEPDRIFGYGKELAKRAMRAHSQNHKFILGKPIPFENRRLADGNQQSLDTHPLIRQFFAQRLRESDPRTWKTAHLRLFEHLRNSAPYWPEGLHGLQPLYQAIAHGCQAGMHREAYNEVYDKRIIRSNKFNPKYYSIHQLGLVGTDLAAVSCFLEQQWHKPSALLSKADQALLLAQVSYYLYCMGRLSEAIDPMRIGLRMTVKQRKWKNASICSVDLSELELALGEIAKAIGTAKKSVTYAERSHDLLVRVRSRSTLANAFHQSGSPDKARARFDDAQELQTKEQPKGPPIDMLSNFYYCDLLLAGVERAAWRVFCNNNLNQGDNGASHIALSQDVEQHIGRKSDLIEGPSVLLDIARHDFIRGRASLYRSIIQKSEVGSAKSDVEHAVEIFHEAGDMSHLVWALLTRAWFRIAQGQPDLAREDLDEAWQIAERGPMRLHLADTYLYRARLFFREQQYPWTSPQTDLAAARRIIRAFGYGRRKEELELAEEAVNNWQHA